MTTTAPPLDVPRGLEAHAPEHVATYLALLRFAADGEESPTLHDLTQVMGLTSASTVVRRLVQMEDAGLIVRHPWKGAKRVRYELTLRA